MLPSVACWRVRLFGCSRADFAPSWACRTCRWTPYTWPVLLAWRWSAERQSGPAVRPHPDGRVRPVGRRLVSGLPLGLEQRWQAACHCGFGDWLELQGIDDAGQPLAHITHAPMWPCWQHRAQGNFAALLDGLRHAKPTTRTLRHWIQHRTWSSGP